jgi:putative membrane protein
MNPQTSKIALLKKTVNTFRSELLVAILVIFYTVGTVGILREASREQFLSLSFFNLLLSFSVLVVGRKDRTWLFYAFVGLCYATGLIAEYIGVHTGLLFGEYSYGENLGLKVMGIPLIIGVNWAMLVLTSGSFLVHYNLGNWLKSMLAAALMTGLDAIMEPVAMKSDFWNWKNGAIPFYNYVCWFFISWALLWIGFKLKLIESNKVSKALFILLSVFFTILSF